MAVDSTLPSPLGAPASDKDAKALQFIEEMTKNVDSTLPSPLGAPASDKDAKALQFIEEMTKNVDSVQERVLGEILSRNADRPETEYLNRFQLNGSTDRETFKSKIPVVTYEDLQPEIQRIANGDQSPIISARPISEFLTSSGTSAGERKLMPTIQEELDRRRLLYSLLMLVMDLLVFCFLLFLIWTFVGAKCVTIEETIPTIPESTATNSNEEHLPIINNTDRGSPSMINTTMYLNPQIPRSNASNSLTGENLTSFGLSERRETLGANADTDATANGKSSGINYNDIPRAYTRPNSPPNKAANPYQKACNPANRCRQGNKAKLNGLRGS